MSSPIVAAYCPASADVGPVDFAAATAHHLGASLHVVAVHPGGKLIDRLSGGEFHAASADEDAERAFESLRPLLASHGVTATFDVVEHATPARGLAQAVEELAPGLLVVGSSGRGRVGRVLPGGTAERLIHGSPCAVAVVPHAHRHPARRALTIGAGFVPTPEGRVALRAAAGLARRFGAHLLATMALSPRHAEDQTTGLLAVQQHYYDPREEKFAHERLTAGDSLDAALAELADGVDAEADVLFQHPVDGLTAASERMDLLVIGSRAYGPVGAVMLGGVSRRVIERAACPVLVLPRGTDQPLEAILQREDVQAAP